MAGKTSIEWTDNNWNPVRGCSRVSAGCGGPGPHGGCYAEGIAARFSGPGLPYEGLAKMVTLRDGRKEGRWTGEVRFVEEHLTDPLRWKKPRRVFVNSMSDLFHEKIPDEWIDRIFAVMALAPQHTFQVLTKRPERMRAYLTRARSKFGEEVLGAYEHIYNAMDRLGRDGAAEPHPYRRAFPNGMPWPLPNVWLGTSIEDQPTADERVPLLLDTPAAIRFVSAEPLLGLIDLTRVGNIASVRSAFPGAVGREERGKPASGAGSISGVQIDAIGSPGSCITFFQTPDHMGGFTAISPREWPRLDWIIVGGESGPKARPMHPDWARSLRDQCVTAGVAFFYKQWGEHAVVYDRQRDDPDWRRCGEIERSTPRGRWLNLAGGHGFHGDSVVRVNPVGKAAAGRLLDGRTWDEFPEPSHD